MLFPEAMTQEVRDMITGKLLPLLKIDSYLYQENKLHELTLIWP